MSEADTYPYPSTTTHDEARRIWMTDDNVGRVAFVAESEGQVVATAYLKPNQPGLGDHIANAGWMVKPSMRGLGIGRRFAVYVIEQARQRGYLGMQFNAVVSTNEAAVALWKSLGFDVVGTVPRAFRHHRDGLVPIYIMYRDL
ncbi:MAG: GNAT family N-acetyltransferase [Acidimicrobiia bacterium]